MSRTSIYTRKILSSCEFRLLLIHPALDQYRQLECYSLPFEVDTAPSHEAFSYLWGTPEPSVEILCKGQTAAIQTELANALTRSRLRNATRLVWTDALATNQDDNEEKNHQVPSMSSIYSLVSRVVV